jgi:hypothetical protein
MSGPRAAAALLAPLLLLAACGCQPARYARTAADAEMFGAQAVRIHPTFTRAKDWSGDGKPDGVEAVLELQDEFGEPTRATGTARFEAYQYRPYHPDPRGRRVGQVWEWPLLTRQEQVDHWSRALRAYSFKLPFDPGSRTVVLSVTFDLDGGTPRLFDQIILEPSGRNTPVPSPESGAAQTRPARRARPDRRPATQPAAPAATQPTTQPGEPAALPDSPPEAQPATPPAAQPDAPEPNAPQSDSSQPHAPPPSNPATPPPGANAADPPQFRPADGAPLAK